VERERARIGESAEIVHASFTDRVQEVTGESLRRFDEVSRQALEKARSDMEYNREESLTQFQKLLDDKMTQGVEQAQTYLQSQLVPLAESFEAQRQAQQRDWLGQLKKSTDESIEQYKARLENTSNSWLLASATTLGQHSQTVLDTLAKAAEKRMRESIAGVLAGMGDTLKDRLLGISSDFGADDEDDGEAPSKKK
jgi:delta 1-pyrroline-5-carboxylate dehydrogenase